MRAAQRNARARDERRECGSTLQFVPDALVAVDHHSRHDGCTVGNQRPIRSMYAFQQPLSPMVSHIKLRKFLHG
jgi:hypothetical protein